MPDLPGVNSRRAQTLVAVREMVLRGEFAPGEPSSRWSFRERSALRGRSFAPLWKYCTRKACWKNCPRAYTSPRIFSAQDIADAIEARGALEGLAAGLAAKPRHRIPPNWPGSATVSAELWKRRLRLAQRNLPLPIRWRVLAKLNLAFHKALAELAGSPILQLSLDRIQSIAFASPAAVVTPAEPGGLAEAIREHAAILDAIQARDAVLAETLVREHARLAMRGVKVLLTRPARAAKAKVIAALTGSLRQNPLCRGSEHVRSGRPLRLSWYWKRPPHFSAKKDSARPPRGDRRASEHSSGIALLPHVRKRGTAVSPQQTYPRSGGANGSVKRS